jgi:pyruvate,water dikinase
MSLFRFLRKENACHFLVNPDGRLAQKYAHFKALLENNNEALDILAGLEQLYYGGGTFSMAAVRDATKRLSDATGELVVMLNALVGNRYPDLREALARVEAGLTPHFGGTVVTGGADADPVLSLAAVDPAKAWLVGGKAANMAVMRNQLGMPTPDGFSITSAAFEAFLNVGGLRQVVEAQLDRASPLDLEELEARCRVLRAQVMATDLPQAIATGIMAEVDRLEREAGGPVLLAMRSSAVGEDSQASFAGQYTTILNVGRNGVLDAYKSVVASKYTPSAILYRLRYGLDEADTPMCVLGLVMVPSRASGVLYTADPGGQLDPEGAPALRVNAVLGLGEQLVSGRATPDVFLLARSPLRILQQDVSAKSERLVALADGGTSLEAVSGEEGQRASVSEAVVLDLAARALALETHFRTPQDVEWAVDPAGRLILLQTRPLEAAVTASDAPPPVRQADIPNPVLVSGGKTAAPGASAGPAFVLGTAGRETMPEGAILVARTAAPEHAALLDRAAGLVTDIGGVASHLASVARELGLPALFDAGDATTRIPHGQTVTLWADAAAVYEGEVPELAHARSGRRSHVFDSPMHKRLRNLLDLIAPLNLTDPEAPEFSPAGCRTIHDIIRFAHEKSMKSMFALCDDAGDEANVVRLKAGIPLVLYCVDLGGGLKENLTTCDEVAASHVESVPMRALWKGLTHPGVSWSGGVALSARNMLALMASSTTAADAPGGDSYAVISRDYVNLSAKFGYHYANIDALCGQEPGQNYVTLRFSGGVGSFSGRSMRINFLASVLSRLGYVVGITGDLLDASLKGADCATLGEVLDQTGRLLGSSRLLDLAIANPGQVEGMVGMFFRGDYDFLGQSDRNKVPGFYSLQGDWTLDGGEAPVLRQDGSKWVDGLSSGVASLAGKFMGKRYQEFLDGLEAYAYFPLAVARDHQAGDADIAVEVQALSGNIDRAGGLAFGLQNSGNYFAFRVNALEDNVVLFEFVDNRRLERAKVEMPVRSGQWMRLSVRVRGNQISCLVDGQAVIEHEAGKPVAGFVGLWTKADSVTLFRNLTLNIGGEQLSLVLATPPSVSGFHRTAGNSTDAQEAS